jgi:hypothetical protein
MTEKISAKFGISVTQVLHRSRSSRPGPFPHEQGAAACVETAVADSGHGAFPQHPTSMGSMARRTLSSTRRTLSRSAASSLLTSLLL